jgi:1-acyl-sn-glycerol-3-phosphate acyltransferase
VKPEGLLPRLPRSVFVWVSLLGLFASFAVFAAPVVFVLVALGLDPDRRWTTRVGQAGFRGLLTWCTWIGLARVRGERPRRGTFVVASNHESSLDTCLALAFAPRPTRLVSKAANRRLPIVGPAAWASGVLFLSEEPGALLDEAIRSVQRGVSVAFFAEGSRSRGRGVRRYRKGAFEVAAATGAPVLPVVIVGSGEFMPPGWPGPLGPYRITVEFLPARRVEGDPTAFARALRAEVAARHAAILAEPFHAPTRTERATMPISSPEGVESLERAETTAP